MIENLIEQIINNPTINSTPILKWIISVIFVESKPTKLLFIFFLSFISFMIGIIVLLFEIYILFINISNISLNKELVLFIIIIAFAICSFLVVIFSLKTIFLIKGKTFIFNGLSKYSFSRNNGPFIHLFFGDIICLFFIIIAIIGQIDIYYGNLNCGSGDCGGIVVIGLLIIFITPILLTPGTIITYFNIKKGYSIITKENILQ